MNVIKKRTYILAFLTLFALAISIVISIFSSIIFEIQMKIILAITSWTSVLLAVLCISEFSKLRTAKLINENKILHIYPIISCDNYDDELRIEKVKGIEVLISYFGILMGSTIIKFNQDNICLKAVEISKSFISITYGKDKQLKNTRINYYPIGIQEVEEIVKKIQYETGIKPTIIN